eukprot:28230-Chlamydomonas_euryale.AAC.2
MHLSRARKGKVYIRYRVVRFIQISRRTGHTDIALYGSYRYGVVRFIQIACMRVTLPARLALRVRPCGLSVTLLGSTLLPAWSALVAERGRETREWPACAFECTFSGLHPPPSAASVLSHWTGIAKTRFNTFMNILGVSLAALGHSEILEEALLQ